MNNVPFDVAESWPDDMRMAYGIIFREHSQPVKYDFESGSFVSTLPS